ncbi:MAG: glycosyltransferase [Candidatus ainarchaeum sp.]|nr:glycosyltransferase [Candidatus ainarchaeum sp.]MDD4662664.1 glycosyltransferase [Candidatus ainarchaeum sp.]
MDKILFLVRLPPPVHGAAKMNELYLNSSLLNNEFIIKHIKLNFYSSLKQNWFHILLVLIGFLKVLFLLFYNLLFLRPKAVYFEMAPKGVAFYRDSIYIWILKLFNKKIVCHFHAKGVSTEINTSWKLKYYKSVFKKVNLILLSPKLYSDVKNIIPKEQVYYLPNGLKNEISEVEFKSIILERSKNKELNLLFLSNMIESKGPLDVLKICNLLKKDHIKFKCYFAGAWDSIEFEKKWFSYLKKNNLENNCFYLGPKYGLEKKLLLSKTNYLVFPTKYLLECYPLVILEAFMFGVPVLSYDNGAITDIINDKKLGFVSLKSDYKDIYKYLKNNFALSINNYTYIRSKFNKNHLFKIQENNLNNIFYEVFK